MNKKEARQKKHEAQKRRNRDILDSPIIGGDDDEEEKFDDAETELEDEQEETLLGNLAPIKDITVLPWRLKLSMPLNKFTFNMAAKADDEMIELFREISEQEENLIGFIPIVGDDGKNSFTQVMEAMDAGVGIAAEVVKVKKTLLGNHEVELQGICRFEITGLASQGEKYSKMNVRWFEDDEEPDEVLKPLYEEHMKIVEQISRMRGKIMRFFQNRADYPKYDSRAAQYASFMFIYTFADWFTRREEIELLFLTSTAERFRRVIERARKKLPDLDNKWKIEQKTKNN